MRMRKKKNLEPRMARCADIWVQDPAERRENWLKDRAETVLHLEIGCGKGTFTVETAAQETDALLVAIEREQNAMVMAMERTLDLEISNILFIDGDARHLPELFAAGEVGRIYINFCDPWPGPRHEKRRLTSPQFLALYKQILAPGGEIHFKTDNRALFDYSLPQFSACGFATEQVTRDLHADGTVGVMTDYERKFHEAGVPICRCVARWETV